MNLLSLLRRVTPPVPPRADPVDPPVVGRARAFEDADAAPAWAVPDRFRWEGPDRCELAEEDRLLDRVAVLVAGGVSPWDAAAAVFGGAGEAPETAGAGLYATVAGEAGGSVPR